MRVRVLTIAVVLMMAAGFVGAQSQTPLFVVLPGAFQLNVNVGRIEGFGARALGMGGAYVAVADDATAASWNPAGLAQLDKKQLQLGGQWIRREATRDYSIDSFMRSANSVQNFDYTMTEYSSASDSSFEPEFITFAYPWQFGEYGQNTFVLAGSYYQNASFFEDYRFKNNAPTDIYQYMVNTGSIGDATTRFHTSFNEVLTRIQRDGETKNYALSGAFSWSDRFYVGLTLNYLDDNRKTLSSAQYFGVVQQAEVFQDDAWTTPPGLPVGESDLVTSSNSYDVNSSGVSAILGFLWRPNDVWSFALTYRPQTSIDYDYVLESTYCDVNDSSESEPGGCMSTDSNNGSTDYDMAEVWTLGLAWRPIPQLNIALDYSSSDWKDTSFKTKPTRPEENIPEDRDYHEAYYYPGLGRVDGDAWSYETDALVDNRDFGNRQWKDETWHLGAEYTIPGDGWDFLLRGGFFTEDAVSGLPNVAQPHVVGYAVGFGYLKNNFFLDLALTQDSIRMNNGDVIEGDFYSNYRFPNVVGGGFLDSYQHWNSMKYEWTQRRIILSAGFTF